MFMLRHYGQDEGGRRTTVNYFSARASAGGAGGGAEAAVGAATVRTAIAGEADAETRALRDDRLAAELGGFAGVTLDAEAEAAVNAALEACAARTRAAAAALAEGGGAAVDAAADDPGEVFVRVAATVDPIAAS